MDSIRVSERVVVPEQAIDLAFARSSGPGGQNVNKVSSKVELRIDLDAIQGLSDSARARLRALARRRDRQGRWLVTSQRTRDQARNLADAAAKVRAVVAACLTAPKRRRATRPSAGSVARRLDEKRRRSRQKKLRLGRAEE